MQITVFHRDQGEISKVAVVTLVDERDYEAACEIAWSMTQNNCGRWSRGSHFEDGVENFDFHPEIEVKAPLKVVAGHVYGLRSSIVGDIFCADGEHWFEVASFGFERCAPVSYARVWPRGYASDEQAQFFFQRDEGVDPVNLAHLRYGPTARVFETVPAAFPPPRPADPAFIRSMSGDNS